MEVPLYKLTVSLTEDNDLAIDVEYIKPELLAATCNEFKEEYVHGYRLAAVIRHCILNGIELNDELERLLKNV